MHLLHFSVLYRTMNLVVVQLSSGIVFFGSTQKKRGYRKLPSVSDGVSDLENISNPSSTSFLCTIRRGEL